MTRHLKPAQLQVEIANAFKRGPAEGRAFMQQITRGEIVPTDDDGKPLDFSAGPTTCAVAPAVELKRDRSGRVIVQPAELIKPQVEARGEIDMDRFRSQMKVIENFNEEDKKRATKAIYLEHLGVEI